MVEEEARCFFIQTVPWEFWQCYCCEDWINKNCVVVACGCEDTARLKHRENLFVCQECYESRNGD